MPTTSVNILFRANDQVSGVFRKIFSGITGNFSSINSAFGKLNTGLASSASLTQKNANILANGFAKAEVRLSSFSRAFQRFNKEVVGNMDISVAMSGVQQLGQKITDTLKSPVGAAIEFQSAMSDVKKVVDFPTPVALKELEKTLFRMSTTEKIPLRPEDLTAIAAAAGQLGINLKDIPDFTRTVAKMSTAFDMLAGDAGDSMAKLANIYQIPITQIGLVGDAINHLSNNTAAKANDMVNVLGRVGGVSKAFGLTAVQAGALGNAFLALGKPADVAATGINAMLTKLQTASKQGKKFQEALGLLNIDASKLEQSIGKNAQGALLAFLKTLEKVDKSKRMGVLTDLFGLEYSDDVAALVGGLNEYKKAIGLVAKEANYAGSMQKEFEARAATTANTIQLLKNRAHILGITIGNALLPTIDQASNFLGTLIDKVTAFAEANSGMIKQVSFAVAGFGGFLLALSGIGLGVQVATASIAAIKLAVSLAISPIGLFTTSLVTGAILIQKNWSSVKSFFTGFFDGIKLGFSPIQVEFSKLVTALTPIKQALSPIIDFFKQLFEPVSRSAKAIAEFYTAGHSLGTGLASIISGTIKLTTSLVKQYSSVGVAIIETLGDGAVKAGKYLWNKILSVFQFVSDLFPHSPAKSGPFSSLIEWGQSLIETFAYGVLAGGKYLWNTLKNVFEVAETQFFNFIKWVTAKVSSIDYSGLSTSIIESSISGYTFVKTKTTELIGWIDDKFKSIDFSGLVTSLGKVIGITYDYVIDKITKLIEWISDAFSGINIVNSFETALGKLNSIVASFGTWLFSQVGKAFKLAFENPAIGAAMTGVLIAFQNNPILSYIRTWLIPAITLTVGALGTWATALATVTMFFGRFIGTATGIGIAITLAIQYREQLALISSATKLLANDIAQVNFSQMWADTNFRMVSGFFKEMYTDAQKFFTGTFAGDLLNNIRNLAGFFQENYKWIGVFGVALMGLIAKFTIFKRKDPCAGNPLAKCFKKQTQQLIQIQREMVKPQQSILLTPPGRIIDGECKHIIDGGKDDKKKLPHDETKKKTGLFSNIREASLAATTAIATAWKKASEAVANYIDEAKFTGSMPEKGSQSEINRRTSERADQISEERGYRTRDQRAEARKEAQSEVSKQASKQRTYFQSVVAAAANFSSKMGSYFTVARAKIAAFGTYIASSTIGTKIIAVFGNSWIFAKTKVIGFFRVLSSLTLVSTAASMAMGAFGTVVAALSSPIWITVAAVTAVAGAAYLIYRNWGNIGQFFSGLWQQVSGFFTSYGGKIVNFLNQVWPGLGSLVGAIGNLFVGLGPMIGGIWDTIVATLKLDFASAGTALLSALSSGIRAAGTFLYDAFFAVLEMIGLYLPHSDAQKGPLSTLTQSGMAIPMTLAKGVMAAGSVLIESLTAILTKAWDYISSFDWSSIGNKVFQGTKTVTTNAITSARSNIPGYDSAINAVSGLMGKVFGDPLAKVDPTESGKAAINSIGKGITQAGDEPIKEPLRGTLFNTAKLLPNSDAEEGPFSTLTKSGTAIPQQLAIGVESNQRIFLDSIQNMVQQAGAIIANANLGATNVLSQGSVAPQIASQELPITAPTLPVVGLPKPKVMTVTDKGAITDIIRQTAKKYSISEEDFLRFAAIETGNKFDPRAYNKGSKAKGLFQFVPIASKQYGITGREFDAKVNTDAAARMYINNAKQMKKKGIETSAANMYLAHQQGVGGLNQIVRASRGQAGLKASIKRNIMWNVPGAVKKRMAGKSDQEIAKIFLQHWHNKFAAIDVSKITKTAAGKANISPNVVMPAAAAIPAISGSAPAGGKFTEKGLTLKSREAIAGGGTKEGTFALGHAIQKNVEGFKYFTAFDDAYHHSKAYQARKRAAGKSISSPHNRGVALDFTIKDASKSAKAAQQTKDILAQAGVKGRVIDEYKIKTAGGTGGHIHVDFKNATDAEKFKQFMLGANQTAKTVSTATTDLKKATPSIANNIGKSTDNLTKAVATTQTPPTLPTPPSINPLIPKSSFVADEPSLMPKTLPDLEIKPIPDLVPPITSTPIDNILKEKMPTFPLGNLPPITDILKNPSTVISDVLKGGIPNVTDILKGKVPENLPLPPTLSDIFKQETAAVTNNSTVNNQSFSKQNKSISINVGDIRVEVGGNSGVDVNSIGQQIKSQLESALSNSWRGSMFDI
jgi:TP901 family phage tail tape measure protein